MLNDKHLNAVVVQNTYWLSLLNAEMIVEILVPNRKYHAYLKKTSQKTLMSFEAVFIVNSTK